MGELWAAALAEIKDRIGSQNFDTWIKPVRFLAKNKNEITLEVPNKSFVMATENYLSQKKVFWVAMAKQEIILYFRQSKLESRARQENRLKRREGRERPTAQ